MPVRQTAYLLSSKVAPSVKLYEHHITLSHAARGVFIINDSVQQRDLYPFFVGFT